MSTAQTTQSKGGKQAKRLTRNRMYQRHIPQIPDTVKALHYRIRELEFYVAELKAKNSRLALESGLYKAEFKQARWAIQQMHESKKLREAKQSGGSFALP